MKVLITGAHGQVGRALQRTAPAGVALYPTDVVDLDICDPGAVERYFAAHVPDIVINAAAYTAVDKAETDMAAARRLNADAVLNLAQAADFHGSRLIHISTDFVFDGTASAPYPTDAAPAPLSVYGQTKYEGERAAGPSALIVRTSWVYSTLGSNFVLTMLRLMSERDELRVIADQVGTPTAATSLSQALWALTAQGGVGIWHYTDSGVASWYDFAVAIQEEALSLGMLRHAIPIVPISTADYPTPAKRPSYSVLDKSATVAALGGAAPHWRANLRAMLRESVIYA
ncbi:dTDP-4-dehydrorhamnose reductase [soil metagenome]